MPVARSTRTRSLTDVGQQAGLPVQGDSIGLNASGVAPSLAARSLVFCSVSQPSSIGRRTMLAPGSTATGRHGADGE